MRALKYMVKVSANFVEEIKAFSEAVPEAVSTTSSAERRMK